METQSQENESPLEVLDQIINELSGFLKDCWLSRLTGVRGKIQGSLAELASEIEKQKEEGKAEIQALWRDEIDPRKAEIQGLKSEIEKQKEEGKAEIEALWRDEIDPRKVEIGRYRTVLELISPSSKSLVENLQRDKSTAESNLKLMQEKLDRLKPELDRRQSLVEGITKRIEQIDGQTKGIESEIENLRGGGDFWLEEIEGLQAQKTALASLVEKFWESLGKSEGNISRIEKKIAEAQEDNDRWQAHIDELAKRIKGTEALFREIAEFSEPYPKPDDQGALLDDAPPTVH